MATVAPVGCGKTKDRNGCFSVGRCFKTGGGGPDIKCGGGRLMSAAVTGGGGQAADRAGVGVGSGKFGGKLIGSGYDGLGGGATVEAATAVEC